MSVAFHDRFCYSTACSLTLMYLHSVGKLPQKWKYM